MNRHDTRDVRAGMPFVYSLAAAMLLVGSNLSNSKAGYLDTGALPWRADLGSAQLEAKEKDLVLWLQFTGPWCPNCRRMDRGAFVHPTVIGLAREKFVPIKLRSDEFESLAVNLGLTVLPSTVLVRPNGEVIGKLEGYADPTEFYAFLQENLVKEGRTGAKTAAKPVPPAPTGIALSSYCPVSLVNDHKLTAGKPEFTAKHGDLEYRFASAGNRDEFLSRPERYLPVNSGRSPVCQVDGGDCRPGDPRFGVTYKGRLYLCADVHERDLFLLNPERYAHVGEFDRARSGDRRGLWALIRPRAVTAPTLPNADHAEPALFQALRTQADSIRR